MQTKVCGTCAEEKPVGDFYIHTSGTIEKHCKKCKLERQKSYRLRESSESGVPHEQEFIDMLMLKGIYACSGKKSRQRWVDVVAFGCVSIEVKRASKKLNSAGNVLLTWSFTQRQKRTGIRGDIIALFIDAGDEFDYHLYPAQSPFFYRDGRLIDPTVTFASRPRPKRVLANAFRHSLDATRNKPGLIFEVLKDKIEKMQRGEYIEKWQRA